MKQRASRKLKSLHRLQGGDASAQPTQERLARAEGFFEIGGDGPASSGKRVYMMKDAPLDQMLARRAIEPAEYRALQRFKHHWYHGHLAGSMSSVDLNRIFAADFSSMSGMPKSEREAHHRAQYRKACETIGARGQRVVDQVVCCEQTLASAGMTLGWHNKPQAIAAASEVLRDAGTRLARFWGIG